MYQLKSRRGARVAAIMTLAALVGLAPIRAFAADTSVTAEITGGLLTISAPASADLGAVSAAVGSTLNSNLGGTTVEDDRGSLLGWTVTAVSDGDMVGANPSNTISLSGTPSALQWVTGTVSASGSSLLTGVAAGAGGGINASTPVTVATAALGAGGGVYTFDPSLTLTVPPNTYADTYTVTITQTVA